MSKPKYPHEPRRWEASPGQVGVYCLNDGQVWPCSTAKRRKWPSAQAQQQPSEATNGK